MSARLPTLRYAKQPITGGAGQAYKKALILRVNDVENNTPFLHMVEDWCRPPGGFEAHPHYGMQTLSIVLSGSLRHRDNKGNVGVLNAGDSQWMTAGDGIVHEEKPASQDVHFLQLWINIPSDRTMPKSRYYDLFGDKAPQRQQDKSVAQVIVGHELPDVDTLISGTVLLIKLEAGGSYEHSLPVNHNAFAHVIEGQVTACDENSSTPEGTTLILAASDKDFKSSSKKVETIRFRSTAAATILLCDGLPLADQQVVQQGPFVASSLQGLQKAFDLYNTGSAGFKAWPHNDD